MASKKDNLPLTIDQDENTTGTITYANEVIAIIAGVAANEVEGVAGMCSGGKSFGKNKGITKGVKVELGSEEAAIDLYLIVEYGTPIQTAAFNVQENVRKAVESMTGLHVVRVDVHVQGVSFEKEQKTLEEGIEGISAPVQEPVPVQPVHVEFEGEPTPAEEHEPQPEEEEIPEPAAEAPAEPAEEPAAEPAAEAEEIPETAAEAEE